MQRNNKSKRTRFFPLKFDKRRFSMKKWKKRVFKQQIQKKNDVY